MVPIPHSEYIVVHNQLVVVLQSLGAHGHPWTEKKLTLYLHGIFHPRVLSSGAVATGADFKLLVQH